MEVIFFFASLNNFLSKLDSAFAALGKTFGNGKISTLFLAILLDIINLCLGIGIKMVDCNNNGNAEFFKIINMSTEVYAALFECFKIFFLKVILCNAAVIFH